MNEHLRDFIAKLAEEAERRTGWLELEGCDGAAHLVGGSLACHEDGVAFEDDSGLLAEMPYRLIAAVRTGRQGEPGAGRRRPLPAFAPNLAA